MRSLIFSLILPASGATDYAALYKHFETLGNDLALYNAAGMWHSPHAAAIRQQTLSQNPVGAEPVNRLVV